MVASSAYVNEISPIPIRGTLSQINMLLFSVGMLFAAVLGLPQVRMHFENSDSYRLNSFLPVGRLTFFIKTNEILRRMINSVSVNVEIRKSALAYQYVQCSSFYHKERL